MSECLMPTEAKGFHLLAGRAETVGLPTLLPAPHSLSHPLNTLKVWTCISESTEGTNRQMAANLFNCSKDPGTEAEW